jgi:type I restriction enzyme S subunit
VPSKKGDVLIPASTTTSNLDVATAASISEENVLLGGDINILRPKSEINSEFLAILLSSVEKYNLAKRAQGITIVHLYGKDIAKMHVTLPAIGEQNEVVRIYKNIRSELALLNKKLDSVKLQKKYLLKNLITGRIRTPERLSDSPKQKEITYA